MPPTSAPTNKQIKAVVQVHAYNTCTKKALDILAKNADIRKEVNSKISHRKRKDMDKTDRQALAVIQSNTANILPLMNKVSGIAGVVEATKSVISKGLLSPNAVLNSTVVTPCTASNKENERNTKRRRISSEKKRSRTPY